MIDKIIKEQKDIIEKLEDKLELEMFKYNLYLKAKEKENKMVGLDKSCSINEAVDVFQDKRVPELDLEDENNIFSEFPSEEYGLEFDSKKNYPIKTYGTITEPAGTEKLTTRVGEVEINKEDNPYFMFLGIYNYVETIKKVSYDLPLALTKEERELANKAKEEEGTLWNLYENPTLRDLENYLIRDNSFVVAGHYAIRDFTVTDNMAIEGGIPFRYTRLLLEPVTTKIKRERFADKDYKYFMWKNGFNDIRANCTEEQVRFFKKNIKSGTLDYAKVFSSGIHYEALLSLNESFIKLGIFKLKFNKSSFKKEDFDKAENKNEFIQKNGRLTMKSEFKHMYNMDELFKDGLEEGKENDFK